MKLTIKNIGKMSESTIELKGITVIAGENDTGKSTFGKILYSVFNSFFMIDERIKKERISSITTVFKKNFEDAQYVKYRKEIKQFITYIVDCEQDKVLLNFKINEFLKIYKSKNIDIEKISLEVKNIINIKNEDLFKNILQKQLNFEFSDQINNIFFEEQQAKIELTIKNKIMEVFIDKNKVSRFNNIQNLRTEVIYIDDTFILDKLGDYTYTAIESMLYKGSPGKQQHSIHLLEKLDKNFKTITGIFDETLLGEEQDNNVVNDILREKRINTILKKINNICLGKLVVNKNSIKYEINPGVSFYLKNVSTGIKTFIILKTLLQNGSLEENGTIILDEPEIHLHPEWQILLAEIIVVMQKELNLHVLINSHSPYFIWAIEVYSKKYKIQDKCRYYLTENMGKENKSFIVKNKTDNIKEIYDKLGNPFNKLESEELEL